MPRSRIHTKPGSGIGFAPRLEALEGRCVPANNVTGVMSGSTLVITADVDPDIADNQNSITITATAANNFELLGFGVTTVNGKAPGIGANYTGVTSIRCVLGLGNDSVALALTKADLAGSFNVQGGDGNNIVTIDAKGAKRSVGSVTITNGDGNDTLALLGAAAGLTVTGAFKINNGPGGSATQLGSPGDTLSLGSISITNGIGMDSVNSGGVALNVAGAVSINNGNGGSQMSFLATSTTIAGLVTVTNGIGEDTFTAGDNILDSFTAQKGMTISNGAGLSSTLFDAGVVDVIGNLTVTSGAGGQVFNANISGKTDTFVVVGNVTISSGNGTTTTDFGANVNTVITGTLSLSRAEEFDSFSAGNGLGSSVNLGALTLHNGNGGSRTMFDAVTVTVGGAITILNGTGRDEFDNTAGAANAQKFSAASTISINNGSGSSSTRFAATLQNKVVGKISITNGEGHDSFTFGGGGLAVDTLGGLSLVNGNGGSSTEFDAHNATILGSATISNGADFDFFDNNPLGNTVSFAATSLSIQNGAGGNSTSFHSNTLDKLTGALSVTSASGHDALLLGGGLGSELQLAGVTVSNGSGGSNSLIEAGKITLTGKLSVSSLDGHDTFNLKAGAVGKVALQSVNINPGAGGHVTSFDGGTIAINGAVTVVSGDGNADFRTTTGLTSKFTATGAVSIASGVGSSTILLSAGISVNLGSLQVNSPNAQTFVHMTGVSIANATSIQLGALADVLDIDNGVFLGAVNVAMGAGQDQLDIEQLDVGTSTQFKGTAAFNLGAGDDSLRVGRVGDPNDFAAFAKSVTINGGTGLDSAAYRSTTTKILGPRFNSFATNPIVTGIESES